VVWCGVVCRGVQVVGDAHESAMENISLVSWGLDWVLDAKAGEHPL
jgi:hypothetical protein